MGKLEMSKIATPLGDSKEVQIRLNGRPYPPFTIKKLLICFSHFKKAVS